MRIDMTAPILGLSGEPLKEGTKEDSPILTLGGICATALLAPDEKDKELPGKEKVERFSLALKVNDAKEPIDLSTEEIVLLKKLIARTYAVLVVGRAYVLLETGVPLKAEGAPPSPPKPE